MRKQLFRSLFLPERTRYPTTRLAKWLYEAKMFLFTLAYLAMLAVFVAIVLGLMLLAFVVTVVVDLWNNRFGKEIRSVA